MLQQLGTPRHPSRSPRPARSWRLAAVLAAVLGLGCATTAPDAARAAAAGSSAAQPERPAGTVTVIVTRHAERADDGSTQDPALSEAGHARAAALADALAGAGVSAVLTTQYLRTRSTAAPLASRLGLGVEVVEAASGGTAEHIAALSRAVRSYPDGSVILVVGHSNTVPLLVRELSGRHVPDMADSEYGTLYIVTLPPAGSAARVIRASYP